MEQEVRNFGRFYAAFSRLPYDGDREDMKKSIVMQYTWNRTDSLREMTREEYNACCGALEELSGLRAEQKKRRSQCLHLMQRLGVDTGDWARVNDFCRNPRIAGKEFARLSVEDLEDLSRKLRAIGRNGGLSAGKRRKAEESPAGMRQEYVLIDPSPGLAN